MSSRTAKLLAISTSLAQTDERACTTAQAVKPAAKSLLRYLKLKLKADEALVKDLLLNQPDALTVLFERHSALVFRIARRILNNDVEAEDIVQQVFLDLFRAADQFRPEKGSFKSWLLMFTYHRAFNRRRQLRTRSFYDSGSIEDLPHELAEGAGRSLGLAPAEAAILVEQMLTQIQPRQRRIIELTYYEGLTAEQASDVTGESVRVVRHNLYRGLHNLRTALCKKKTATAQIPCRKGRSLS